MPCRSSQRCSDERVNCGLETAGLTVHIDQGQNTLYIDGERIEGCIDIGMNEAAEGTATLVGRVQVGTINRHPRLFFVPNVYKRILKPLLLAVVPERLMVVYLHHATVV
jgi:hypothetical protein